MKNEPIGYHDALKIIHRLLEAAESRGRPFQEPIVMVGGTAMTAHDIRKMSYDVDLYISDFHDDVVYEIEREFRSEYGPNFKIDVTSVENIWGGIMLRDIGQSEPHHVMRVGDRDITIRKLSPEDLFLIKLDTGREKDRDDLAVLYEKTDPDRLIGRFNAIWKWHGNRDAVLGYADSFVSALQRLGGHHPADVVSRLKLPAYMVESLSDGWNPEGS